MSTKIIDTKPGDKNLEVKFIILEKLMTVNLKNDDKLTQFLVADETASIKWNFFGEVGESFKPGDIIYMNGAYTSLYKGMLVLYQGKKGMVHRLRDFFFLFDETCLKSNKQATE